MELFGQMSGGVLARPSLVQRIQFISIWFTNIRLLIKVIFNNNVCRLESCLFLMTTGDSCEIWQRLRYR